MKSWIEEESEDNLIEQFGIQPGDLFRTIENAKWLLHATSNLAKLYGNEKISTLSSELHKRVSRGIKKELLAIVQLEGVGRVRGRILFNKGYRTINDIKLAPFNDLTDLPLIGLGLARKLKEQVGSFLTKEELEKTEKGKGWKQGFLSEY